jgi:hypothetical protein
LKVHWELKLTGLLSVNCLTRPWLMNTDFRFADQSMLSEFEGHWVTQNSCWQSVRKQTFHTGTLAISCLYYQQAWVYTATFEFFKDHEFLIFEFFKDHDGVVTSGTVRKSL